MYSMTRIEGVNRVLEVSSGEVIASQQDLETLPQAVKANGVLDTAVAEILVQFLWYYNSVDRLTLSADGNGEIILPSTLSHITILSSTPVQRNYLRPVDGKLYNISDATFNLGADASVDIKGRYIWEFTQLPVAFQLFAVAQARRYIVSGSSHISPTRTAIESQAWNNAYQGACKFDDELSGGKSRNPSSSRRTPPFNGGFI